MIFDKKAVAEFRRPFEEKGGDIFIALGIEPVEIVEGRAVMKMPFMPNTSQLTGVFAAGALMSLADITATAACGKINGAFPFSVQVSANLLQNTNTGDATAEAKVVHAGRTMKVVETVVRDDKERVLVRMNTTHLVVALPKGGEPITAKLAHVPDAKGQKHPHNTDVANR